MPKQIGKGTTVSVGSTVVGLVEKLTLPPRAWEIIEGDVLNPVDGEGDPVDIEDVDLGDEAPSEFVFTEYYTASASGAIDTAFAAKNAITITVTSPAPLSESWSFSAKLISISPQEVTKKGHYKREIRARRVGPIS